MIVRARCPFWTSNELDFCSENRAGIKMLLMHLRKTWCTFIFRKFSNNNMWWQQPQNYKNDPRALMTYFPPNLSVMRTHTTTYCTLAAWGYVFSENFELSNHTSESCLHGACFSFLCQVISGCNMHTKKQDFLLANSSFLLAMLCLQASRKQDIIPTTISTPLWHRNLPHFSSTCIFPACDPYTRSYASPNALRTISQPPVSWDFVVRDSIIVTTTSQGSAHKNDLLRGVSEHGQISLY